MFERYTERARRVIFFARYEASAVGSPEIETEHILLGLMRENRRMLETFSAHAPKEEAVRARALARTGALPKTSISVDLPLSNDSKQALMYAAEEASGLANTHIASEHLLLGLLRVEVSLAAEILNEGGLHLEGVREQLRTTPPADQRSPSEELLTRKIAQAQTAAARTLATTVDMTPQAMRAMMFAEEEAATGGQKQIGPEHLLLGLLRVEGSPAGKILGESGLRVEELRKRLRHREPSAE